MTDNEFDAYMKDRFLWTLEWYHKRAGDHKLYFVLTQITIIVGGATSPVLVALTEADSVQLSVVWPIVASAFVAISAGLQSTFKYQDLWVRYRGAAESMRRMKARFDLGVGSYEIDDLTMRRKKLVDQTERLLAAENNAWISEFEEGKDDS